MNLRDTRLVDPKSVLIAEDNRDAADVLAALIRAHGHSVETAADGLEAIAKAQALQPQVAIVDITLPKLNGLSVARRLRSYSWGTRMLLIAVTGWTHQELRGSAYEAGFDSYLIKPVDPHELISLIYSPTKRVPIGRAGTNYSAP